MALWIVLGSAAGVAGIIFLLAQAARPYADDTYEPPPDSSETNSSAATKWDDHI